MCKKYQNVINCKQYKYRRNAEILSYDEKQEFKEIWKGESTHVQYQRKVENLNGELQWQCLERAGVKREAESLAVAAQEQAVKTILTISENNKSQEESKCRMRREVETVYHTLNECTKLEQRDKNRRHDWGGHKTHWKVCNMYNITVLEKLYQHELSGVMNSDKCKARVFIPN